MTSFRPIGEDFGTWYGLDEAGDLAVSVWGAGTAYLTRDQVADLRDHLNAVLANANGGVEVAACCCADAGRVVSAARAWRDGRRDRVAGAVYHQQCRDLCAAVNALDEEITPAELPVRRRVPTQAERIAAGHHRITPDRYGETLDLIATAVETATDDTLRDGIRSMIRQVRPEALDLWSPPPTRRPTTIAGTDRCPATRRTGIADRPGTLTCNRGAGHAPATHRDPVYGYWTHPATEETDRD